MSEAVDGLALRGATANDALAAPASEQFDLARLPPGGMSIATSHLRSPIQQVEQFPIEMIEHGLTT
jgi:hypothetical protein